MTGLTKVVVGVAAVIVAGVLVGWRVYEHRYALPQATCGSAVTHGLDAQTQLLSADPGALPCFHAAAVSCRSASIKVVEMGVDAATDDVFVIKPGGRPCQVTEFSQFSIFTGAVHRDRVSTTPCRVAAVTAQGVTLSCDGQHLLIPVTVSQGA